jgi:hypothetical protein
MHPNTTNTTNVTRKMAAKQSVIENVRDGLGLCVAVRQ